MIRVHGDNTANISKINLQAPGAIGGSVSLDALVLICQVRGKHGDDAVMFDETTSMMLPQISTGKWPEGLALNLRGWGGLREGEGKRPHTLVGDGCSGCRRRW